MDATVSMTGRLGTDVETRLSRNGNEYATFRLANSNRYLKDGQWMESDTTWVSVRCYRNLGINVAHSLRKGQSVVVVGRLRVEGWTNRETGVTGTSTVIDAQTVGHDLSWGVTRFAKLERDRSEPASSDAEPAEPDHENDDRFEPSNGGHLDEAPDSAVDAAAAERLLGRLAEPIGAAD